MQRLALTAQRLALQGAAHACLLPPATATSAIAWHASQQVHALRAFADNADVRNRRLAAAAARAKAAQAQQAQGGSAAGDARHLQAPGSDSLVQAAAEQPSEVAVTEVLDHPALIVTRAIEWGTVILGYEQATKYTVYDHSGEVVALMAEQRTGLANELGRQLLRTHRSFTTTVFTANGLQEVFRVRRPAYLLNSVMYIEDPEGHPIGEVRQRWHPWQRNYDVYIGRRQFAAINSPLLAWEFELKDEAGGTLALIDRNFLGFARELFTDAGQYVVHFGFRPAEAAAIQQQTLAARSGQADVKVDPVSDSAAGKELTVIPSYTGKQLTVARPLTLDERMIALATAISVDYNYFSRHSNSPGLFSPPLFLPIPFPGGGGGAATGAGTASAEAGATGGAAAGSAEAAGGATGSAGADGLGAMPSGGGTAGPAGDAGANAGWGDAGFQPYDEAASGQPPGGWGGDAESFKWDIGGDGGGDGGGGEDGPVASVLRFIWELMGGGND